MFDVNLTATELLSGGLRKIKRYIKDQWNIAELKYSKQCSDVIKALRNKIQANLCECEIECDALKDEIQNKIENFPKDNRFLKAEIKDLTQDLKNATKHSQQLELLLADVNNLYVIIQLNERL